MSAPEQGDVASGGSPRRKISEDGMMEKPVRHVLYRQSSLETRLYPEQDLGDSEEEEKENQAQIRRPVEEESQPYRPRVVSMVAKANLSTPKQDELPVRRSSASSPSRTCATELPKKLAERAQATENLPQAASDEGLYAVMDKSKKKSPSPVPPSVKNKPVNSNLVIGKPQNVSVVVSKNAQPVSVRQCNPQINVVEEDSGPPVPKGSPARPGETTLQRKVRFQEDSKKSASENSPSPPNHVKPAEEDEIYAEIDVQAQQAQSTESCVGTLKAITSSVPSNMASPRPKSPRPGAVSARGEKEESFWEKIGTLGRKKRIKEVQEVQEEGKNAIDSPGNPLAPDLPPEDYTLEENEERSMITPQSYEDPRLKDLMFVLTEWINDELASQRIIVKDLEQDLYDGQVLHKLIEILTGEHIDVPEVTLSEEGQKQKLNMVLATANKVLGLPRWSQQKWSVESIHSKNVISILHLLVALARHFRAPVRLPERVAVQVVVVQMHNGTLSHRTVTEEITSTYDDLGQKGERDAFDTLFDHAPDKLQVVKKSLITFVNKHLNKLGMEVSDLDTQFHDGVYLVLLMGLLEGFFVPLYGFHSTPHDFDQKVHNVNLAFDLMQEVGLARPKARPEDIVNLDLKSTLRVLYNLFTKYKGMS